jgi:hypothetical protein
MKNIFFALFLFAFTSIIFSQEDTTIEIKNKFDLTNRIVSFEFMDLKTDSITNETKEIWGPIGTGFFVGLSSVFKDRLFLITSKHVIDYYIKNNYGDLLIRYPYYYEKDKKIHNVRLVLEENKYSKFLIYPKDACYDICAIDITEVPQKEMNFIILSDIIVVTSAYPISQILSSQDTLQQGNFVGFIGYPFGLSGKNKNFLIERFGIISTIITEDYEDLCGKHYLINSICMGGDSGSPVFLHSLNFLTVNYTPKVIGVLRGNYFPGLIVVEPIDIIMNEIMKYLEKF